MKKSRKLLCVLLALVMVVGLLPGMAFAADVEETEPAEAAAVDTETGAEAEGIGDIIDVIGGITLPSYTVTVVTNKGVPPSAPRSRSPISLPVIPSPIRPISSAPQF